MSNGFWGLFFFDIWFVCCESLMDPDTDVDWEVKHIPNITPRLSKGKKVKICEKNA